MKVKSRIKSIVALSLLVVSMLILSNSTVAQTVTLQGASSTPAANKIKMEVNTGGNFQVSYKGFGQIYYPTSSPGSGANVPGTVQGIVIAIGDTYWSFGSLGNPYGDSSTKKITGFTYGGNGMDRGNGVTNSATKTGVAGGYQTYTMVHTITKGGKQYIFTVKYAYPGTGTEVIATYSVQAPANNTESIKIAHGWDSYLGGSDSGPGEYVGTRGVLGETVSVTRGCDAYQGFEYVSGTPWSGHFSAYYPRLQDELNGDMIYGNNTTDGIINTNGSTDNGVGISIDFGTPVGKTVQSTSRMIFAPNQSAPTLSTSYATNSCPQEEVTKEQLRALVTNGGSIVKFYTATPAAAANEAVFPITTSTTLYAANTLNNCIYDTSIPITIDIVECCKAQDAAPQLSATTIPTSCANGNKADLSAITATNQPTGAMLTWHSATPATNANKLTNITALDAGVYYAAFYDATSDCYNTQGPATLTVTQSNCATGTINCDGVVLLAPTVGNNQYTLLVPIDVTTAGCIEITSLSGAGMTLPQNISSACTPKTGLQQVSIPLNYDGTTTLSNVAITFSIAGQTCSLEINNTTTKQGVFNYYSKENCTPKQVAPVLKVNAN